ncbi:MAG: hypothetical protein JJT94_03690 [Bernardetiaceae bacterium]|nr:hypothetical protein [Bernardetiaceae bacterium]
MAISCLLLSTTLAFSQQSTYKTYTIREGLPGMQVTALQEDDDGQIWIATKSGVAVFNDGKIYEPDSMPRNNNFMIFDITKDRQGQIWFDTYSDFIAIHTENQSYKVQCYPKNNEQPTTWKETYKDKQGYFFKYSIWWDLTTAKKDSLQVFDTERHTLYNLPTPREEVAVVAGYKRTFGTWSLDGIVLSKLPLKSNAMSQEFLEVELEKASQHYFAKLYAGIIEAGNPEAWDIPYHNFFPKEGDAKFLTLHTHHSESQVLFIRYTGADSRRVLVYHDLEKGIEKKWFLEKGWHINAMILDRHKNVWLGTEQGLIKLFSTATYFYDKEHGLPAMPWSVVEAADDEILIGSYSEKPYIFKLENNQISKFTNSHKDITLHYFGARRTPKKEAVLPTALDAWLYKDKQFVRLSTQPKLPATEKQKIQHEHPSSLLISYTDTIKDEIALGGVNCFVVYDANRQPKAALLKETFEGENVLAIEKTDEGVYFIGTNSGYLLYDAEQDSILHRLNTDKKQEFDAGTITLIRTLAKDTKGNIWCGTQEINGKFALKIYDTQTHRFETVLEDFVTDWTETLLLLPEQGILLFSQNQALFAVHLERFYEKKGNYLFAYDKDNGFLGLEPSQNSLMQDSRGRVWCLTGDESLYRFDKIDTSLFNLPTFGVDYTKVSSFDQQSKRWAAMGTLQPKATFEFGSAIRSLRFKMYTATQESPEQLRYAFRYWREQRGGWSEWQESDGDFSLSDLKPGDYKLEVRAYYYYDTQSYSNKPTTTFSFRLNFKWYELVWLQTFGVFLFILLFATSFYFFRQDIIKKKKLKKQNQILKERDEEISQQNEELQLQANSLEVQNKEIKLQSNKLEVQNKKLQEQAETLELKNESINWLKDNLEHELKNDFEKIKAANHINVKLLGTQAEQQKFFDMRVSWNTILAYYDLSLSKEPEADSLITYLEKCVSLVLKSYHKTAIKTHIDCNMKVINKGNRKTIPVIRTVVVELVRNSCKHAFPTHWEREPAIYLSVLQGGKSIFIHYRDNGIGIDEKVNPPEDSQGYGLLQDKSHTKDFVWENAPEGGFQVALRLRKMLEQ